MVIRWGGYCRGCYDKIYKRIKYGRKSLAELRETRAFQATLAKREKWLETIRVRARLVRVERRIKQGGLRHAPMSVTERAVHDYRKATSWWGQPGAIKMPVVAVEEVVEQRKAV